MAKKEEVYRSKIGVLYSIPGALFVVFNIGTLNDTLDHGAGWEIALFAPLHVVFIVGVIWCAFTKYVIREDIFVVCSGPFRWRVPLKSITAIAPSDSQLSAPALAMDRLEVAHKKGRVIVSPRRKEEFAVALQQAVLRAGGIEISVKGTQRW